MSGVYESDRKPSPCDHMALARVLRFEMTALMASEKVVPKKHRLLLSVPTIATARELVNNVETAEAFYPSTAHGVLWRKHYLTIAGMLGKELDTLTSRKRNTKLTGTAGIDERIAKLRYQLAELEEVAADMPVP